MRFGKKTGLWSAALATLLLAGPVQAQFQYNHRATELQRDPRAVNPDAQRNLPQQRDNMSADFTQDPTRVTAPGGMYGRDNNLGARDPDNIGRYQVKPGDLLPQNPYGSNKRERERSTGIRAGDRTSLNRQDAVRDSERSRSQQGNQPGTRRHLGSTPQGTSQTPSSAGGSTSGGTSQLGSTMRAPAAGGVGTTTSSATSPGIVRRMIPRKVGPGQAAPGSTAPAPSTTQPTSPGANAPSSTAVPPSSVGSPSMGGSGPGSSGPAGGTLGGSSGGMGSSSAGGGGAPGR